MTMQTKEQKQLFLDMQEHPENYTDEQLETMMDDLDRVPDVQQAWKEFLGSEKLRVKSEEGLARRPEGESQFAAALPSFRKVAAVFIGILLVSGIAIAAIQLVDRLHQFKEENTPTSAAADSSLFTLHSSLPSPVRFDDVRLDSILTVVSAHYGKAVSYRNDEARAMQFIMTWKPDAPLADFIEGLNMFDGLHLSLQGDTIVVETVNEKVSI